MAADLRLVLMSPDIRTEAMSYRYVGAGPYDLVPIEGIKYTRVGGPVAFNMYATAHKRMRIHKRQ